MPDWGQMALTPRSARTAILVVVCTLNRHADLARFISSLVAQSFRSWHLLIVNGGRQIPRELGLDDRISIIDTEPGLTAQRNTGLDWAAQFEPQLVAFFDDDVELYPDALQVAWNFHESHADLAGFGVRILSPHSQIGRLPKLRNAGKVLKSGRSIPYWGDDSPKRLDWISGCSMFFNHSFLKDLRFDENRTGYGLGEDVDFTFRLRMQNGELGYEPGARVIHHESSVNRLKTIELGEKTALHRGLLWAVFPDFFSRPRIVFGVARDALAHFVLGGVQGRAFSRGLLRGSRSLLLHFARPDLKRG